VSASRVLDAVVVGAGPNGLAAAIELARAGRGVLVVEARGTIGGGCRTAELTLRGFHHDVCSAIHPLGRSSPVFAAWPLERYGLEWIEAPIQLAHPLDDRPPGIVLRDLAATADGIGADGERYARLMRPFVADWERLVPDLLGPLRIPLQPARAFRLIRFGVHAIQSATLLGRRFAEPRARALLAGCAAHSMLRLEEPISGAFGLSLLVSAHAVGWPLPRGGSQRIVDALAGYLRELGGEIRTGWQVRTLAELPPHRAALLDLTPRQVLSVAGDRLRGWYARQLRGYRYGPGSFKLDLALDGPIPWRDQQLAEAAMIHLGGTMAEIAASERAVRRGAVPGRPFVLLAQPSRFDASRAPEGKHTVWAYCHVPHGSPVDMAERIERQIERFAPGFRDRILARHAMSAVEMEAYNANVVGGDINGGLQDLRQLWTRPAIRLDPYSTPDPRLFICSSSTPPGGGVHGLCGYHAARSALRGVLS
jgi:phytoene dehydrogenase-like protein